VVGLGVLADVTGSAVLVWRFRAERRHPARSGTAETRAAIVVAVALAVVSAVLITESAAALASGSRPVTSGVTLGVAGVSFVVLAHRPEAAAGSWSQPGTALRTFFARVPGPGTAVRPAIQVIGPELGRRGDFLLDLLSNIVIFQ
jgi:hypothetical protein